MTNIKMELSVADMSANVHHIQKVIKGRKKPLEIEIYGQKVLFVYDNIEMHVSIKDINTSNNIILAKYVLINPLSLFSLITKYKKYDFFKISFEDIGLRIMIDNTVFSFCAKKVM